MIGYEYIIVYLHSYAINPIVDRFIFIYPTIIRSLFRYFGLTFPVLIPSKNLHPQPGESHEITRIRSENSGFSPGFRTSYDSHRAKTYSQFISPLVGGLEILEHVFFMTFHILGIVTPTDELHHFSEG
jgi:hypothetical protein